LAITEENYTNYQTALTNNENVDNYFAMWTKLAAANSAANFDGDIIVDGGEITE
jgi:hypothetical protein